MRDVEVNNEDPCSDREYAKFQELVQNSKKQLFPGSNVSLLDTVVRLLKVKASNCWSDRSFTTLLKELQDILPTGMFCP